MRILLALVLALLAGAALLYYRSRPDPAGAPQAIGSAATRTDAVASELAQEARPPEQERAALAPAASADQSSNTEAEASASAHLDVHVRGSRSRTPAANTSVQVFSRISNETLAVGTTSVFGELSLRVPANTPLVVRAAMPGRPGYDEQKQVREGVGPGARAEIEILLREEDDARVFGQVLTEESGAPIAGARIELRELSAAADRAPPAFTTAEDGRFEIAFTSWTRPYLSIAAEGRGTRLADPAGHDDVSRPLVVRLARASTLEIRAHDAAGAPLAGASVQVGAWGIALDVATTEGAGFFMRDSIFAPEQSWTATTGIDGLATVAGLPAGVELRPAVTWQKTHLELERVKLAPGEVRRIEVLLGGGTRIVGIALDERSKPIPGLSVCLAEDGRSTGLRTFVLEDLHLRETARADEAGRFAFEPVEPGLWLVAPARGEGAGGVRFAALPVRVRTAGEPEVALTLNACGGLHLEGSVLDSEGKPVANARVEAYAEEQMFWGDTRTEANGSFRLGPVTQDEFTLLAYGGSRGCSEPVRARPQSSGVVLRLQRAGQLAGRVVDASGGGCAAQLMFSPEQRGYGPFGNGGMMSTDPDGTFVLPGLGAGRYGLAAMTADGRFGLQTGIEVVAGGATNGIVLTLVPGGRLALHYTGAQPQLFVSVTHGGAPVHFGEQLAPGGRVTLLAPAGDVVLELRSDPFGAPRRLPLRLAAGETQTLEFGD